jgi:2-keto-4-pentenoate hydratase
VLEGGAQCAATSNPTTPNRQRYQQSRTVLPTPRTRATKIGHSPTIGRVSALLYVNEAIEETGVAAGVLGHPANGVAWLANRLAAYDEYLPAGQVILSGSFTRPVFVRSGDVIHADFGDLGAVTCQFV